MTKTKILFMIIGLALICLPSPTFAGEIYSEDEAGNTSERTLPPRTVILTFDDGPSDYTLQILKILQDKNVKATFFVVGKQSLRHNHLKAIYDGGHEIGNHTFSHHDMSKLPNWRIKLELNLTRLIIESQTGHSTRVFRPPFLGSDSIPTEARQLISKINRAGYITVGENVDTKDWRKPGVDQIIQNATANSSGGIILLHDGGGDRSQTIQALPMIIDDYQKRGYQFSTIHQSLGILRDQVMPGLSTRSIILSTLATIVFGAYSLASRALTWVIFILIIASFGRMALVITAALVQSRRKYPPSDQVNTPCSIVVPAYNESAVIQSCLKSLLASDYQNFEVIVVDDGSKDNTSELARATPDSRLKVVRKINGGKASALNYGIGLTRTNFIIAIDADTVFRHDTLRQLMRHFKNTKVGAVSGNTRIANRHKLITSLQSLEYIVGFNLDRRMGDLFDCITVVPGAIGAFRKSALQKVGGFTYDTLAEDTDLTLAIKKEGYKIIYDASAIAYTEAPSTIKDLLKQRFRWTFGTMQAVYKHKKAIFNPKYKTLGTVGLPYLLFYQILFPLLSPLFDVAVIIGLLNHQYQLMAISLAIYTAADVIMSGIALRLDGEKLWQLWLLIPQRIIYRQLMYYVIVKSLINVLRGNLVGWGSLKREGSHLAKASE